MSAPPWHDVELPEDPSAWFPVFVELPKGSKVKYELDKPAGLLRVSRVLHSRRFFLDCKVLEGKEVTVEAPLGAPEAMPVLRDAVALYSKEGDKLR